MNPQFNWTTINDTLNPFITPQCVNWCYEQATIQLQQYIYTDAHFIPITSMGMLIAYKLLNRYSEKIRNAHPQYTKTKESRIKWFLLNGAIYLIAINSIYHLFIK